MRKLLSLVAVVAMGSTALVACGSGEPNAANGDFGTSGVKVTEEFGKKPTVTHKEGEPDKGLVTEVLKEGDRRRGEEGRTAGRELPRPDLARQQGLRQLL